MNQTLDNTCAFLDRAADGDAQALGLLFERHRSRLEMMVRLRLDRRLQGRLDPANALQFVFRTTTTAADGSYTFTGLLPGTYNVTVLVARKDIGIHGIKLGVGQTLSDEDFSLPGAESKR